MKLTLKATNGLYAVCRLNPDQKIPEWSLNGEFFSISKTDDELSVVCDNDLVPSGVKCEMNWRIMKIEGPLNFSMKGVLYNISKVLYEKDISIFVVSTYDTDYILVKDYYLKKAIKVLKNAGYQID